MAEGIVIGNLQIPIAKGQKGDTGEAGKIISISLVMLSPTATPYATNTGTQTDAVIELGVPRGLAVSTVNINASGELVFTFNDGTSSNVGQVVGKGISEVTVTEDFDFVVTYTDGTSVTACNLEDEVLGTINDILESYYTKTEIDNKGFITKEVDNLTNYTLKTSTGSSIELSINTTTYVMTLNLKNANGTVISTGTVDLPLETMVVGATYDNTNKKIVLTLKNGSTIDVPVADLVSGLQSKINSNNKLSSDLVNDTNQTNKFVTASEKEQITTNATDISNIKDGTSIDSFGDVETALSGKEDSSNKTGVLNSSSTTTQYPHAKAVYDELVERDEEINQLWNDHPDILDNNALPSGTDLTLNGTGDLKIKVDVGGNSTQETTSTSEGDEYDSPSPEHKQDINNVEGNVVVKGSSKNLFDKNDVTLGAYLKAGGALEIDANSFYTDYIDVSKYIDITFSGLDITETNRRIIFYDKNKTLTDYFATRNRTINVPSANASDNTKVPYYMRISADINYLNTLQVELSTQATSYVPFGENTVTFPLSQGQKLMLGDTLEDDGIHHKRKQTTFTGTTATLSDAKTNGAYLCDQKISGNLNGQTLTFDNAVTNAIIEYELATETITPYTSAQQTAYNKLKEMQSYYDLTYVVGSSDNAQPILTVHAKKSLKVMNNEINNLISRVTLLED